MNLDQPPTTPTERSLHANQWLNELLLLERLDLFESKEERRELKKMLAQARLERDMALLRLESAGHA